MGWGIKGKCSVCKKENIRVFYCFGKLKCKECIEKTKKNIIGHSGMIYHKNTAIQLSFNKGLTLKLVKKSELLYVKWYIEHYPKSKGIVGRQLNYLIYYNSEPIGIIGIASPPLNYKLFKEYFNTDNSKLYVNNNVFRIVNKPNDKNIGTKILKQLRNKIVVDYYKKYKDKLIGIITFVEPPRTGAIYKADNWDYLGMTKGIEVRRRGKNWYNKEFKQGTKKLIFAKKLKKL